MAEVLFVSKPLVPPWNDSSKNLARDISSHLKRHEPVLPNLTRPALMRRLLLGPRSDVWHFFFAPNARASAAGRVARALRHIPTVHTACSLPPLGAPTKNLLFADVTVALSNAAYDRFRTDGTSEIALRQIPPCVPALAEPSASERATLRRAHGLPATAAVWLYPGDLELGDGARMAIEAFAACQATDAILIMACRQKTRAAAAAQNELVDETRRWGIERRVRWLGETPHIHALLGLSDYVLMVSSDPYAKMDYPLVALEAMCLRRPVLVAKGTPAAELANEGAAIAVPPRPDAIADAIRRLDTDEAALTALGIAARERVLTIHSPATVAASYERLYEELRG